MTKKKEEPAPEKKDAGKKRILYELVEESELREYIITGALAKAGLLPQFEKEKTDYGFQEVKPSLTQKEFDKILSDFLGN
ncbi:MAG: hypothetical protein K6A34_06135 [Methanobrevibacter sp.]|nr:hypothetical protein [Methanobrevibacter sp.]